jgi:hypothetical protein
MFKTIKELALGFDVQVIADPILSPKVVYEESMTAIYFEDEEAQNCRITFERLDSIRVCRGEYCPYDSDWRKDSPYLWVSKVQNSKWLKERYQYESKNYKNAYGFGASVDEMITEYSHYLFSFHDEYIEVLAAGIWLEKSQEKLNANELSKGHPFLPLDHTNMEIIDAHGIVCHIWKNSTAVDQIVQNAKYCSQCLMEFAPELDGSISTSIYLSLRYRNDELCSVLTKNFGGELANFKGVAKLDDVRSYIEEWLREVSQRRKAMKK